MEGRDRAWRFWSGMAGQGRAVMECNGAVMRDRSRRLGYGAAVEARNGEIWQGQPVNHLLTRLNNDAD